MPRIIGPGQNEGRATDHGDSVLRGQVRRRGTAQNRRQQRLVDVDRAQGLVCERGWWSLGSAADHKRPHPVMVDGFRCLTHRLTLRPARLPSRRRAGQNHPVEAIRCSRDRMKQDRRPHRRSNAAHSIDAQNIEQRQQIVGEVGPDIVRVNRPTIGHAVAAHVVPHHSPSGTDEGASGERASHVILGTAPGQAMDADDHRTGTSVIVGDPHATHSSVHPNIVPHSWTRGPDVTSSDWFGFAIGNHARRGRSLGLSAGPQGHARLLMLTRVTIALVVLARSVVVAGGNARHVDEPVRS